jgi:putative tricarboxylic transport membrane protein
MTSPEQQVDSAPTPVVLRQGVVGGAIIAAFGGIAFWLSSDLQVGTLGGMGPGMLPRALSILLAALGCLLIVVSFEGAGERLNIGSLRAPLFVLGALAAFGLTVRPLGLAVSGVVAILISAFASNEVRWGETIVSAILTTLFCVLLFKLALRLPIPLAPWLLGY